jgi:hypothetical protein
MTFGFGLLLFVVVVVELASMVDMLIDRMNASGSERQEGRGSLNASNDVV